jgi:glycosyltransferase involved in cell wall biosynthesis
MHRSGTSALTRVLGLAGADLPRRLIEARPDNERGYWESADVQESHDRLLDALGRGWDDVRPLPTGWLQSEAALRCRQELVATLHRDFEASTLFVLKDPRLCRLLPLWERVLTDFGADPAYVLVFRNPLEVAESLRARNGFDPRHGLLLWLRHVIDAERGSRGAARSLVSYESLLQDWRGTVDRVGRDLGLRWPALTAERVAEAEAFLDGRLRHARFSALDLRRATEAASWVSTLHSALVDAEPGGEVERLSAEVDRVAAAFDDADRAFGPVIEEAGARLRENQGLRIGNVTLQGRVAAREKELAVVVAALSDAQDGLAQRDRRLESLSQEITLSREEAVRASAEIERLAAEADRSRREAADCFDDLASARADLAAGRDRIQGLESEVRSLRDQVESEHRFQVEAQARLLDRQGKEIERLRSALSKSQSGHHTKDGRIRRLEAQLADTAEEGRAREAARAAAYAAELERVEARVRARRPWTEVKSWLLRRVPLPAAPRGHAGASLPRRLVEAGRRRREATLLSSSPLFDAGWYVRTYPDAVDADGGPLIHFLRFGAAEGRRPGPLFDTSWYLERNPDVTRAGTNPLAHYLRRGAAEGRDPNPVFDTSWYLERNPDVAAGGFNPLEHYLRHGAAEGRDPGPGFNTSFYLQANPDVRAAGLNPLEHYLGHGRAEGRAPLPPPPDAKAREATARPPLAGQILLFVGHDGTRSGAPRILLNLVRHAARYGQVQCVTVLDQDGPLRPDYEAVSRVHVMKADRYARDEAVFEAEISAFLASLEGRPVAAVCNTAETASYIPLLEKRGIPCLSLIHEILSLYTPPPVAQIAAAHAVVFPSRFVAEANQPLLEPAAVETRVLSQGLLDPSFGQSGRRPVSEAFRDFDLDDRTLVVLGCGNADWRKGFDLFCLVARKALTLLGDRLAVRFAWVGPYEETFQTAAYWGRWELRKSGVQDALIQIWEVADPEPYYQAAHVFVLPSRADPFPCVVHEAMACGLPVIAFDGSGGAGEAMGDTGVLVPYLDTDAMARAVVALLEDDARRCGLGEAARERVKTRFVFEDYAREVLSLVREKAGLAEWGLGLAPRPDRSRGRVVFASPDWSISGVNTFTRELVVYLLDAGYDAEILFTQDWALRHERDFLPDVPHRFLRPRSQSLPDRWSAFEEYLSGQAPCVLLPNYDYGMSSICPRLPSTVGVLGIVHSDDPDHYEHAYRLGRYWNRIVAVSSAIRDEVVRLNPTFAPVCSVVPYGLDVSAAPVSREVGDVPLELVYSGRFVQVQKRILDYATLVRALEARGLSFRLTMVGDGPLLAEMREKLAEPIREGRVVLTGRLAPPAAHEVYRRSDVFLLLSDFEGLPLTLIEALHYGCIPVVRRIRSGVADVVEDGVNGYVLEAGDFEGFADRLCAIHGSGALRERLSAEARRTIARHGLDRQTMGRRYAELVDGILAEVRDGRYERPRPLGPEPMRGALPSPYVYVWMQNTDTPSRAKEPRHD